jgi:toxin HigB-1
MTEKYALCVRPTDAQQRDTVNRHEHPLDLPAVVRYATRMIRSFKDKETERLFNQKRTRVPSDIHRVARRKLDQLNAAHALSDLTVFPGNNLEALKGNRKGQHSIRIDDRWRICFTWQDTDAHDVEICDYHRG